MTARPLEGYLVRWSGLVLIARGPDGREVSVGEVDDRLATLDHPVTGDRLYEVPAAASQRSSCMLVEAWATQLGAKVAAEVAPPSGAPASLLPCIRIVARHPNGIAVRDVARELDLDAGAVRARLTRCRQLGFITQSGWATRSLYFPSGEGRGRREPIPDPPVDASSAGPQGPGSRPVGSQPAPVAPREVDGGTGAGAGGERDDSDGEGAIGAAVARSGGLDAAADREGGPDGDVRPGPAGAGSAARRGREAVVPATDERRVEASQTGGADAPLTRCEICGEVRDGTGDTARDHGDGRLVHLDCGYADAALRRRAVDDRGSLDDLARLVFATAPRIDEDQVERALRLAHRLGVLEGRAGR